MSAYLIVTGGVFGLLAVEHPVTFVRHDSRLAADPSFVVSVALIRIASRARLAR